MDEKIYSFSELYIISEPFKSKSTGTIKFFEKFLFNFSLLVSFTKNIIKPPFPAPKSFAPSAPLSRPEEINLFILLLETSSANFFL